MAIWAGCLRCAANVADLKEGTDRDRMMEGAKGTYTQIYIYHTFTSAMFSTNVRLKGHISSIWSCDCTSNKKTATIHYKTL